MKKIILFLTWVLFITACTKEKIQPTSAEKTAEELQRIIKANNLKRMYAFEYPGGGWTSLPAGSGTSWTFSNGYVTIGLYSGSYNLDYLYNYKVSQVTLDNGTSEYAILLYFK